jgi:hypothetical protein
VTVAEPAPRAVAVAVRRHKAPSRWVGTLFCQGEFCDTVLAEVMADGDNLTYIQPIGARPKYSDIIPCPQCGALREFKSVRVKPLVVDVLAQKPYSKG